MRSLAIVIAVLIPLSLTSCIGFNVPEAPSVMVATSDNTVTRQVKVADFNSVDASSTFNVEIAQGDDFGVRITADAKTMEYVRVTKAGSTLRLYLDGGIVPFGPFSTEALQAQITMPRLEELELSGASHGEIRNFKENQDVSLRLSGASGVRGRVDARNIQFDVSGASTVDGVEGTAQVMTIHGSGASRLELKNYKVDNATVELSGASSATINVRAVLNYDLSGGARLDYLGTPQVDRADVSGGASANAR